MRRREVAVTTNVGEMEMGRSAGDVTALSDVGDVAITTCGRQRWDGNKRWGRDGGGIRK